MNLIKNILVTFLSQIPFILIFICFPETLKIALVFVGGFYVLDKTSDPLRSYLMGLFGVKKLK